MKAKPDGVSPSCYLPNMSLQNRGIKEELTSHRRIDAINKPWEGSKLTAQELLQQVKGKLIVSCQALEDEPLHGSEIMAAMAKAACLGGAAAIRANGGEDIRAIRREVQVPIIGLRKRDYPNSPVFITPTLIEVEEVVEAGADAVAVDATLRKRPDGKSLKDFIASIRERWSIPIMADVSNPDEACRAVEYGADMVATTLVGYTEDNPQTDPYNPDLAMFEEIIKAASPVPVIAEGRIWEPQHIRSCFEIGAWAVVVGSAITRPRLITKRLIELSK